MRTKIILFIFIIILILSCNSKNQDTNTNEEMTFSFEGLWASPSVRWDVSTFLSIAKLDDKRYLIIFSSFDEDNIENNSNVDRGIAQLVDEKSLKVSLSDWDWTIEGKIVDDEGKKREALIMEDAIDGDIVVTFRRPLEIEINKLVP